MSDCFKIVTFFYQGRSQVIVSVGVIRF